MNLKKFMSANSFLIAGLEYRTAWVSVIDEKSTLGYADTEGKILYLKDGQPIDETFKTMIHELIHAMDHTYNVKLSHAQVRKLELALSEFLIQNEIIK